MSSPTNSKPKLKLTTVPNTITRTSSIAKFGLPDLLDYKFPFQEKEAQADLKSPMISSSNIIIDSVFMESNLGVELNTSDLSIIKILEEENFKAKHDGDVKLRGEINLLKKQLTLKSTIIEKLAKDNLDLRERMEELLKALEHSKANTTSNKIIQDLKQEIADLTKENQLLKDNGKNYKPKIADFEDVCVKSSQEIKEKMDAFYRQLTTQMHEFIDSSKAQYQNYTQTMQNHVTTIKKVTSPRNMDKIISIQSQKKTTLPSGSKSGNFAPISVQLQTTSSSPSRPKSKQESSSIERNKTNQSKPTRKRVFTLHNLFDTTTPTNKSENGFFTATASSPLSQDLSTSSTLKRSPKASFSPQLKAKIISKPTLFTDTDFI